MRSWIAGITKAAFNDSKMLQFTNKRLLISLTIIIFYCSVGKRANDSGLKRVVYWTKVTPLSAFIASAPETLE